MKSIVILLTLFSLYQGFYASNAGCPKGWIRFLGTDRCFYISSTFETYQTGKNACESMNSQLAPPMTCDEHIDLRGLLASKGRACSKGQNCEDFWIGIEKLNGSHWKTSQDFVIENSRQCQQWANGFPIETEGNCVILSLRGYRGRGVWKNTNCTKQLKYVCITCPDNFEFLPEINQCLNFNRKPVTWSVAQRICPKLKRRARLLTIQDPMKQAVVERYLSKYFTKLPPTVCDLHKWADTGKIIWLGAQTADPNQCKSPYVWKPVGTAPIPFAYTNWFPGMPNCGYKDENCAIIAAAPKFLYRWEDLPCTETFCYVCEF